MKDKRFFNLQSQRRQEKKEATIGQLNNEVKLKDSIIDKLKNEKKENDSTISKLKLDKKKDEDCINKLNEESKIQKTEIDKITNSIKLSKEYNKSNSILIHSLTLKFYFFIFFLQINFIKNYHKISIISGNND